MADLHLGRSPDKTFEIVPKPDTKQAVRGSLMLSARKWKLKGMEGGEQRKRENAVAELSC